MSERLPAETGEWGFRLGRETVHEWAHDVLRDGDARDDESRMAMDNFASIQAMLSYNEPLSHVVTLKDPSELAQIVRSRAVEGMSELSEGLAYAGDVQAIVRGSGEEQDEVIDVVGLELVDEASYQVSLRSSDGRLHGYADVRGLLLPKGDDDE